ncbi:MAG: hypothetical protein ACK40G_04150 [Cytophagaceae bacterium]
MLKFIKINIFILLVFCFPLNAQVFNIPSGEAAKLEGRKLLVVLTDDENSKSDQLLKKLIPVYWTASEVEFNNSTGVKKLSKTAKKEYITLQFSGEEEPLDSVTNADRARYLREKKHSKFQLRLIEQFQRYPMHTFYLNTPYPDETDFIIGIKLLSSYIKRVSANNAYSDKKIVDAARKRGDTLQSRILLVDSFLVRKPGKKMPNFSEEYKGQFRLINHAGIDSVLKAGQKDHAYLVIIPYKDILNRGGSFEGTYGGGMDAFEGEFYYTHAIIDAGTGEFLAFIKNEEPYVEKRNFRQYERYRKEPDSMFE